MTRELRAKLAEEIKREAEADPPLTAAQRSRLAALLLRPTSGETA
jgi:hypothetical protein